MSTSEPQDESPPPPPWLQKVNDHIAKHFAKADLQAMARIAGYSQFHFHRIYKQWAGVTPKDAITAHQIARAKQMLAQGAEPTDVAKACGFCHVSHFCTRFKQVVGVTPLQFAGRPRTAEAKHPARRDEQSRRPPAR